MVLSLKCNCQDQKNSHYGIYDDLAANFIDRECIVYSYCWWLLSCKEAIPKALFVRLERVTHGNTRCSHGPRHNSCCVPCVDVFDRFMKVCSCVSCISIKYNRPKHLKEDLLCHAEQPLKVQYVCQCVQVGLARASSAKYSDSIWLSI